MRIHKGESNRVTVAYALVPVWTVPGVLRNRAIRRSSSHSLTRQSLRQGNIEETYYWKGLGLAASGNTSGAREAWQRAVELNAGYTEAASALVGLNEPDRESRLQFPAGTSPELAHRGI